LVGLPGALLTGVADGESAGCSAAAEIVNGVTVDAEEGRVDKDGLTTAPALLIDDDCLE